MTIQFEKTKATLELLKLDLKDYLEKLETLVDEITEKEKKIIDNSSIKGVFK